MIPTRFISLLALAASLPFSTADSFGVIFTDPHSESNWRAGVEAYVTWKTYGHPARNTNPKVDLVLVPETDLKKLDYLASNVSLTSKEARVNVPEGIQTGFYRVKMISNTGVTAESDEFHIDSQQTPNEPG